MTSAQETRLRELTAAYGQEHVFRFWDRLSSEERQHLLDSLEQVDFPLLDRLVKTWVLTEPPEEHFKEIVPVPVIPVARPDDPSAIAAREAGEQALRSFIQ